MSERTKIFSAGVNTVKGVVDGGADTLIDITTNGVNKLAKAGVHVATWTAAAGIKAIGNTAIVAGETLGGAYASLVGSFKAAKALGTAAQQSQGNR